MWREGSSRRLADEVRRIEGPEVHGLTMDNNRRIWVGDASTNAVLVVTPA